MKKTYLTPTTVVVKLQTVSSILQMSATVDGKSGLSDKNKSGDAAGGLSRSFFFDDEDEDED